MKRMFLTIDTECHDYSRKNQYIDGKIGSEYWGIRKILELAKEYGIPANFFVDVGEEKKYGCEFMQQIVEQIHSYQQPVFFHLHPDYISGDKERSFLWQYSFEEKKAILQESLEIYKKYGNCEDRLVFRAGRYGIDTELLELLQGLDIEVLDLSYIYSGEKMCHLSYDDIGTKNGLAQRGKVIILPTTRFVGFDYLGKKKCIGFDTADATLNEFKRYISKTKLQNVVWTMHSWNFIRKWFFLPEYIQGDKDMERKFRKSVDFARENGFSFANLRDLTYQEGPDEVLNLCKGIGGKLLGIINNFVRFQKIARLNKRYFAIYSLFYFVCIICIGIIIRILI